MVGIGETPTDRLGSKPGEPRKSTAEYLAWAARLAIEDAGLTKKDFDGQGLAAIYTTNHSQPFWPEEVAAILGITPGVSLAGGNGGASSVSLLGHAAAAITPGSATSFWSSPQRRRSASAAVIAAPMATPATSRCPSASWDPIARFLS